MQGGIVMPKGKYIEDLLRAYNNRDDEKFRKIAKKIIKDEKSKSHYRLANTLEEIFDSFNSKDKFKNMDSVNESYFNKLPRDDKNGSDLVSIIKPNYYLEEVVLSNENKDVINNILAEYHSATKLKSYNLDAKRRLLFCAPPGCGKTMTAQALANEINLPLLYIHMDSLISSYLGDTASNLRKIFEYAERGKWIIFLDEFDTIGKSREDKNEHGELKRSVNTFLQLLDNFKLKTLLIAATNHQQLLDYAIWRRFDEILYFDKPDPDKIKELLKLKLKVFKANIDFDEITNKLKGMSHAQIERICKDAIRYCIVREIDTVDNDILQKCIAEEKRRKSVYESFKSEE